MYASLFTASGEASTVKGKMKYLVTVFSCSTLNILYEQEVIVPLTVRCFTLGMLYIYTLVLYPNSSWTVLLI